MTDEVYEDQENHPKPDDDLRDRIAATLDRDFNPGRYPVMAAMFRDYAQAIIDEFGLRHEFKPPILAHEKAKQRIIGDWEERP